MADAPELKPCPFCGSDHIAQECGLDGQPYMSCVDCGANVEGKAGAWNTRAAEADAFAAGVRAGLEAAAQECDRTSKEAAGEGGHLQAWFRAQGAELFAIAADPDAVAAIAASAKGGE